MDIGEWSSAQSLVTGLTGFASGAAGLAIIQGLFSLRKNRADARKTNAEAKKIEAEAQKIADPDERDKAFDQLMELVTQLQAQLQARDARESVLLGRIDSMEKQIDSLRRSQLEDAATIAALKAIRMNDTKTIKLLKDEVHHIVTETMKDAAENPPAA